ncbi:uncharacterized protein PG986_009668 [Apiospora aurea]|uniref:Rhodopsin domain-containing protein n=1 Tax=Apiospora aurea TaxID=335848 RepID=A0ABR1Q8A6_9PEZI
MQPQGIVGITTAAVATVIVALRIFTRLQVRRRDLDASDYFYLAAWICMWTFVAFTVVSSEFSPQLANAIEDATYVEGIFWYCSNIVTDLCCLLIPAAIVLPLELGLGKKLSVIALFGLGGLANAAAWWAFAFFLEVQARPDDEEHYFEDRIQVVKKNLILVFVECNGGIICAGIPTIWVFFTHFLPSMVRYYLHPSLYTSNSATEVSTTTTGVDRCKLKRCRQSARSRSLSLDDMPPAMRWDSQEPPAHASESGTAILMASRTIVEDCESVNDERDDIGNDEPDEIAEPPKAVTAGIIVRTGFAVERSGSSAPDYGTRFSYGSTLEQGNSHDL